MRRKLLTGAVAISLAVHGSVLFAFALIQIGLNEKIPELFETVLADSRPPEEVSEELDIDTSVSEELSLVSGGVVTGAIGGGSGTGGSSASASGIAGRIGKSSSLKEPMLVASARDFALPGEGLLGEDLGETAVMGETGAAVEGYGAALSRLTRELLRMMREDRVLVVWLFDESGSMKDDQAEIGSHLGKVYEELGIAAAKDDAVKARRGRGSRPEDEILLTAVVGFGEKTHYLLETPSADLDKIRAAIAEISVDESGLENMSQAVREVAAKYRPAAARQERRLVLVIASDESGDDGQNIEQAIDEVRRARAPVYVLGREAIFGYPYARQRWVDPKFGLAFDRPVNRGPETALPEALQWDGFGARWDVHQSGFGPYDQVRLAKESGGIYFLLPGEEEALSGELARERRKFALFDMREYQPDLGPRRRYEADRKSSEFRDTIWQVILRLNPHLDDQLSVRRYHYPVASDNFRQEAKRNFDMALRAMSLSSEAVGLLERIGPLRSREESWRWRAGYDLVYAQVLAYRVRLFQYLLALDQHVKQAPSPADPKNNVWNLVHSRDLLPPDPQQVRITKVDLDELERQKQKSEELYRFVLEQHPGTPWSRRADQELREGYGFRFAEGYRDPRYFDPGILAQIKLPNL